MELCARCPSGQRIVEAGVRAAAPEIPAQKVGWEPRLLSVCFGSVTVKSGHTRLWEALQSSVGSGGVAIIRRVLSIWSVRVPLWQTNCGHMHFQVVPFNKHLMNIYFVVEFIPGDAGTRKVSDIIFPSGSSVEWTKQVHMHYSVRYITHKNIYRIKAHRKKWYILGTRRKALPRKWYTHLILKDVLVYAKWIKAGKKKTKQP